MTSKRKSMSKKLRFTIFERDGFRCRYCGASNEVTQLHVDHRIAVANGGTDDPDNLLTACIDCNLGKGARELSRHPEASQPIVCPFVEGWPQDIEDPVYSIHGAWAVTGYGLENLTTFYPIEKKRLGELRPSTNLSDWLVHLAEKDWVAADYDHFAEAFVRALRVHRVSVSFDLETSLREGRAEAADTRRQHQPSNRGR